MTKSLINTVAIGVLSACLWTPVAFAQPCTGEEEMRNDDCVPGCTVALCSCFVAGEIAAVQLEAPEDWYPIEVLRVQVFWQSLLGGAPNVLGENILVWDGDSFPNPGVLIGQGEGPQLIDGGLNEFDLEPLPGQIIVQNGKFSVGLEFGEDNLNDPFVGTLGSDDSGCQLGKNMVFALGGGTANPGWHDACALGVSGDWIIRAIVRCAEDDTLRTLTVASTPGGALVDSGTGFFPTPYDLTVNEGDDIALDAFAFATNGDPFTHWELDDQFFSDDNPILVSMTTGTDRIARAVYGSAGLPPEIVHDFGMPGETRPHSGYIDPRQETVDGMAVTESVDEIAILFSEPIRALHGGPLDAGAFQVTSTLGTPPNISAVDASANPLIRVMFDTPFPTMAWTTIQAVVEDMDGNPITNMGDLGDADEPDRVDIGFMPGDVDQSGDVAPLDLFVFRQIVTGAFEPSQGLAVDYGDTNRDGSVTPLDLFRYRQLVNGVSSTVQWGVAATPLGDRP